MNVTKQSQMILIILVSVLIIVLTSCGQRPLDVQATAKPASDFVASEEPGKKAPLEPWGDWDKVVKEGRKEGRVMLYTTLGYDEGRALLEGFQKAQGMNVDLISGNGASLVQKILSEGRAGLHMVDVFDGGTDNWLVLMKNNLVEPAIVPEAMNPSVWKKDPYYLDSEKRLLVYGASDSGEIYINKNLVNPGELQSWQDLLDPKWKGKITMHDPVHSGPGQGNLTRSLVLGWVDENFWWKMAKQEILFSDNRRLIAEWLGKGKAGIGIAMSGMQMRPYIDAGVPISPVWLKEGGHRGVKNITLIKTAPNPNAARLYINWVMSKDGQEYMSRTLMRVSQRTDVSEDFVPEGQKAPPGTKLQWLTLEQLTAGADENILNLAKILTGTK